MMEKSSKSIATFSGPSSSAGSSLIKEEEINTFPHTTTTNNNRTTNDELNSKNDESLSLSWSQILSRSQLLSVPSNTPVHSPSNNLNSLIAAARFDLYNSIDTKIHPTNAVDLLFQPRVLFKNNDSCLDPRNTSLVSPSQVSSKTFLRDINSDEISPSITAGPILQDADNSFNMFESSPSSTTSPSKKGLKAENHEEESKLNYSHYNVSNTHSMSINANLTINTTTNYDQFNSAIDDRESKTLDTTCVFHSSNSYEVLDPQFRMLNEKLDGTSPDDGVDNDDIQDEYDTDKDLEYDELSSSPTVNFATKFPEPKSINELFHINEDLDTPNPIELTGPRITTAVSEQSLHKSHKLTDFAITKQSKHRSSSKGKKPMSKNKSSKTKQAVQVLQIPNPNSLEIKIKHPNFRQLETARKIKKEVLAPTNHDYEEPPINDPYQWSYNTKEFSEIKTDIKLPIRPIAPTVRDSNLRTKRTTKYKPVHNDDDKENEFSSLEASMRTTRTTLRECKEITRSRSNVTGFYQKSPPRSNKNRTKRNSNKRRTAVPLRSKNGCWTCRIRKKKCTEQKPSCGQCVKLGLVCDGYSEEKPEFMATNESQRRKLDDIKRHTSQLKKIGVKKIHKKI